MKCSAILLMFAVCLITGCGDSKPRPLDMGGADGSQVASLIEELNEAVGNPKKIETLFLKASLPADPRKLTQYNYYCVGKPSVQGSSATCKVRIDTTAGVKAGDLDWSFEKVQDTWKIKSAPLP